MGCSIKAFKNIHDSVAAQIHSDRQQVVQVMLEAGSKFHKLGEPRDVQDIVFEQCTCNYPAAVVLGLGPGLS